jgi:LPS export ABC transporter protein LptC
LILRLNLFYRILLSIFLFSSVISCKDNSYQLIKALTKEKLYPTEIARDVVFLMSDSAFIKAKLITPLMETYLTEEPYAEMKSGLNVTFYNKLSVPMGFLSANYGIQYLNKKVIEVKDNVVVVNTQGDTFTTEHLIWNERKDRIYSNKFVRVKTKDEIIMGQGFESDLTFTNYEFENIKGMISLKSSE